MLSLTEKSSKESVTEQGIRHFAALFLTCGQLHPRADLVHVSGVAEEEQAETDHGAHHQEHGGPDEEHSGPEGRRRDGVEVQDAALARELVGERVADAVVKETKVAGLRGVDAVPYPERLDEDHNGDDDEADGEHGPHNADGAGVSHIVGVINFSGLLGWKQVHVSERKREKKKFGKFHKTNHKNTLPLVDVLKVLLWVYFHVHAHLNTDALLSASLC